MKKKLIRKIPVFLLLTVGAIGFGVSKIMVEYFAQNRIQASDFIKLQNDIDQDCLKNEKN